MIETPPKGRLFGTRTHFTSKGERAFEEGGRMMTKQDLVDAVADETGRSKRGAASGVEATPAGISKGIFADQRLS